MAVKIRQIIEAKIKKKSHYGRTTLTEFFIPPLINSTFLERQVKDIPITSRGKHGYFILFFPTIHSFHPYIPRLTIILHIMCYCSMLNPAHVIFLSSLTIRTYPFHPALIPQQASYSQIPVF